MEFLVSPQNIADYGNAWEEACACKAPVSFATCGTVSCNIVTCSGFQRTVGKSYPKGCIGYCRNVTISPM